MHTERHIGRRRYRVPGKGGQRASEKGPLSTSGGRTPGAGNPTTPRRAPQFEAPHDGAGGGNPWHVHLLRWRRTRPTPLTGRTLYRHPGESGPADTGTGLRKTSGVAMDYVGRSRVEFDTQGTRWGSGDRSGHRRWLSGVRQGSASADSSSGWSSRRRACRRSGLPAWSLRSSCPSEGLHQPRAPFLDLLPTLPNPQQDRSVIIFGLRGGGPPHQLLVGLAVLGRYARRRSTNRCYAWLMTPIG